MWYEVESKNTIKKVSLNNDGDLYSVKVAFIGIITLKHFGNMKNNTQIKCPNCGTSIDVQDILAHQLEDEIKQK